MTRAPELLIALEQGAKIALVSDAGMPFVSDPGYRLVTLCLRHQIPLVLCPDLRRYWRRSQLGVTKRGVSLCRISSPARRGAAAGAGTAAHRGSHHYFLRAPRRLEECVAEAREILGDRPACLAREVTKLHEEFRRGNLAMADSLAERPARGEITCYRRRGPGEVARPTRRRASPTGGGINAASPAGPEGRVKLAAKDAD